MVWNQYALKEISKWNDFFLDTNIEVHYLGGETIPVLPYIYKRLHELIFTGYFRNKLSEIKTQALQALFDSECFKEINSSFK